MLGGGGTLALDRGTERARVVGVRQLSLLELGDASTAAVPKLPLPDVPGLGYVEDYITTDEEHALLDAIDREPWLTDWARRRQIYGVSYGSAKADAKELGPLPRWVVPLAERVIREGLVADAIVNVVVNEYTPGQGIGLHHDFPGFGPTVVAVSLGSACLLDLVDPESDRRAVLDVAPRSLWVLGGEARSRFMHGIAARRTDVVGGVKRPRGRRVSVTMRTARRTDG
jgi:2-oxoglutarate-Fe(II)-dependent oxygenase superfamily protein